MYLVKDVSFWDVEILEYVGCLEREWNVDFLYGNFSIINLGFWLLDEKVR